MEYQSRKVKWYWLILFVAFTVGVIVLLFKGNPYLYSHVELHSALLAGAGEHRQTIPSHPESPAKLGNVSGLARFNGAHTAVDPAATPRSRAYADGGLHPIELPPESDWANVVADPMGFYLTGHAPRAVAVDTEGAVRWSFRFLDAPGERGLMPAVLDETGVYLVHPEGEVVCLDKKTGRLRWTIKLDQELAAAPFAWGKSLIVPLKINSAVHLVSLARGNGHVESAPLKIDLKPNFLIAQAPALNALIATADNKVVSIDPEGWKILWSQTLTEPARGPAVVVEGQIFLTTPGGKLVRLDGAKRGKLDWDLDLPKPAATPPAYLPLMHRLTFYDVAGHLVTVDAKSGRVLWRVPVENRNPAAETWSARLKGQNIEEFKMDWLHKGWIVWAPCADRRVCLYTPNKGQLIDRLPLGGQPLALPLPGEKRWTFLTQTKPGHLAISKLIETGELKRLRPAGEDQNSNGKSTDAR